MNVTIKDVARLAGVGVGTASRVISGRGSVAADTAAKVQQAIQTLGFRPSSIARALTARSLDMVGIYVPEFVGLFHGPVLDAVSQQLRQVGRHMVASNGSGTGDARQQAHDGVAFLRQRDCDGLLFIGHDLTDDDLRGLHAEGTQLVIINRVVPGLEPLCFSSDHALGGRLAAQHLLDHGHRRVAMVGGPHSAHDNAERLHAFSRTMAEAGHAVPAEAQVVGNFSPASGVPCAHTLLSRRAALGFTAVFCANDSMAIALISVFQQAGLRVPQDVSVIGYDDCDFAPHTSPPLSTVRVDIGDMAAQATRDLVNRCYDLDLSVGRSFAPVLVPRASVLAIGAPVARPKRPRQAPNTPPRGRNRRAEPLNDKA